MKIEVNSKDLWLVSVTLVECDDNLAAKLTSKIESFDLKSSNYGTNIKHKRRK